MDEMDPQDLEKDDHGFSYKAMLARDRRRWSVADRDGDDNLTRQEFVEFLHPEESAHMRDIVVVRIKNEFHDIFVDDYLIIIYL